MKKGKREKMNLKIFNICYVNIYICYVNIYICSTCCTTKLSTHTTSYRSSLIVSRKVVKNPYSSEF